MTGQTILIADSRMETAGWIQSILEQAGYQTLLAFGAQEAVRLAGSAHPDLILLEQTLPIIPQQELYHAFFQEINLPVILIGEKSSDEDVAAGLETGADDYIVLPCSSSLIVARIRAILRLIDRYRRQKRRRISIGNGYIMVDLEFRTILKNGEEVHLTPTEYSIFELLVRSPNRIFSRDQIITYALEDNFEGYSRSIDTYIKSLRQKLEMDSRTPRHIITVYGVGYKFVP